jgi:hypothetical protein
MSEEAERPSIFSPGTVIELTDVTLLPAFEDIVAASIQPVMTDPQREAWEGRRDAKQVVRPIGHHGGIVALELSVMSDPFERLVDARARGWVLSKGSGNFNRDAANNQQTIARFVGFIMIADAKSSGKGTIGQIQAELWYGPVGNTSNRKKDGTDSLTPNTRNSGGRSICCYAAKARLEKTRANYIAFDTAVRRVGFQALKASLHTSAPKEPRPYYSS